MHVYIRLTSHNSSGSSYVHVNTIYASRLEPDQKVYMLTSFFLKTTCKIQKNVINCYYGISVFGIMETVLISYLGIPVFPVYCPALTKIITYVHLLVYEVLMMIVGATHNKFI